MDTVLDISARDALGNAVHGPVRATGTKASLFYSNGPQIIAIDVEDLIVVATADRILITSRGNSQKIKEMLEQAHARDPS
jgi:mannose-1-phosphate guanylyltransferase